MNEKTIKERVEYLENATETALRKLNAIYDVLGIDCNENRGYMVQTKPKDFIGDVEMDHLNMLRINSAKHMIDHDDEFRANMLNDLTSRIKKSPFELLITNEEDLGFALIVVDQVVENLSEKMKLFGIYANDRSITIGDTPSKRSLLHGPIDINTVIKTDPTMKYLYPEINQFDLIELADIHNLNFAGIVDCEVVFDIPKDESKSKEYIRTAIGYLIYDKSEYDFCHPNMVNVRLFVNPIYLQNNSYSISIHTNFNNYYTK